MLNPVAVTSTTATPPEAPPAPVLRAATTASAESQATGTAKLTTANPSYILDLGLGLVVLQYYDQNGDVSSSIPTERQLQAYRDGGSPVGEAAAKL